MPLSSIERKRATDRKAQQARRERTRNKIAELEQELEYYKKLSQEGNTGIQQECVRLRQENKHLRQRLGAINAIMAIDTALPLPLSLPIPQELLHYEENKVPERSSRSIQGSKFSPECFNSYEPLTHLEMARIYDQVYEVEPDKVSKVQKVDISVIVKAINEGWGALDCLANENPLVRILRDIDQHLFRESNEILRLAVMYKNYHLLKYLIAPGEENIKGLPQWIQPEATGPTIPRANILFFPWPFMRQALNRHYARYSFDDKFAYEMLRCYRFYWPFPFQNAFSFDKEHQTYEISTLFREFCHNLSSWGMDGSFLCTYPEFTDGFRSLVLGEV
ncbi:hypothetical protein BDV26DRAFT_274560 [Aspergillus bertholletiae]|uniref:BZIP domain-containing protein n=1 Tax=Aspergillus bertholletiae TaxID=1226010 RepID=A0A5N7AQT8_9EURO|nr:hypothetical protein BDV26DRAFT_274560 [Aspergillus bertholletiae]